MNPSTLCPAGPSRPHQHLPTASSINGRISLLADLALRDDPRQFVVRPDAGPSSSRVLAPSLPPRYRRRVSRRHCEELAAPPPHLPPSYHPYDNHLRTGSKSHDDRHHISPPSLPTCAPTPVWHSSSPVDFVLPAWIGSTSGSTYQWPTTEMDERIISRHRLPSSSIISPRFLKPDSPIRPNHFDSYTAGSPSPPLSKVHPPPLDSSPPRHPARLYQPHPSRLSARLSSPPMPASPEPQWDTSSEELVSISKRRSQPKRRDIGRRRQQNADAQKRFRSKKKQLQNKLLADLEEARAQLLAKDQVIRKLEDHNEELRKINNILPGHGPWDGSHVS